MPYVVKVKNGKVDKKSAYYTRRLWKKNTKEADRRLRQILNENYTDNELKVEISYEPKEEKADCNAVMEFISELHIATRGREKQKWRIEDELWRHREVIAMAITVTCSALSIIISIISILMTVL